MSIVSSNRLLGNGETVAAWSRPRSALREVLILTGLAVTAALIVALVHPKRPAWGWSRPTVEATTLRDVMRSERPILWIDARAEAAFAEKHTPGALSLNEDNWERQLPAFMAAWQPGIRVIVYCDTQTCTSSQGVAARLQRELKIENLWTLAGGWSALENGVTP